MSPHAAPRLNALLISVFAVGIASAAVAPARGGDMRRIDSRRYVVHTDIKDTFAEQFAQRLDNIHDEYARRLSGFGDDGGNGAGNGAARHEVYLFERQADFQKFTGESSGNVAGIFAPSVNRLALFLHDRPSLYRTLQHEAFHQFSHNAISKEMPIWLDEGLAVYFGEALWTGDRFLVGQVPPDRLKRVREDVRTNRLIPFRQLMSMSLAQWNLAAVSDAERGTTQYNQAWAMVHFLAHGGTATTPYRPHMLNMLKLLHEGTPADRAFAEALSPNIENFQARFVEFVAMMQPSEEAGMLERVQVLAEMMKLLQVEGARFETIAAMRGAVTRSGLRLSYRKGSETYQTEADPGVYFQGPSGQLLPPERLYLAPRLHAPLPDIVCRWKDGLQFRARFFHGPDRKVEHEIVPEGR